MGGARVLLRNFEIFDPMVDDSTTFLPLSTTFSVSSRLSFVSQDQHKTWQNYQLPYPYQQQLPTHRTFQSFFSSIQHVYDEPIRKKEKHTIHSTTFKTLV